MRAVVITAYGGPETLALAERPEPQPKPGMVRIAVKAFGLNHAETYFRAGAWGDVAEISGIECVGEVIDDPDGRLAPGQAVFALMGGLGRTLNGSYAEQVSAPTANVVPIDTRGLSWEALAAIPETYATAWTCLNANLALKTGQTIVIRGGTSALGLAAINLAVRAGASVIATSRKPERAATIEALGAAFALETPDLGRRLLIDHPAGFDAVLDLLGAATLLDSVGMVRRDGRVCVAGFLGGAEPIAGFDPVWQMKDGVHLSVFASARVYGSETYPLSEIPFQEFVDAAAAGDLSAGPVKVFALDQLPEAHRAIEAASLGGKAVVRVAGTGT
ncbi:MAG TPA: zinc-binding dehydrogenase [Caulobacteraceae bacterium]|nr:zinc-binding dehydrogenase [Caulobacteraceae bacterium]